LFSYGLFYFFPGENHIMGDAKGPVSTAKGIEKLEKERKALVSHLSTSGYLKGKAAKEAMLAVPRECFVSMDRFYEAYVDTPMPIPDGATISAPHMHAIYLSAAKMKPGDSVLEV
jgi:protein-L-isoaspartate(D-aspartate) O-methyltransferase